MSDTYQSNDETPEQPDTRDPFLQAVDAVQYDSPDVAARKLREAVEKEAAARNWRLQFERERAMTHEIAQRAQHEHADIEGDENARMLIRNRLLAAQLREVTAADVDLVKHYGRAPLDTEIADHHTALRAGRWKGISSAEELIRQEVGHVRKALGLRTPADRDPARAVRERQEQSRRLRNLPAEGALSDAERPVDDTPPHVYNKSLADLTAEQAGFAGEVSDPDLARRQSAIEKMRDQRRALRGGDFESLRRAPPGDEVSIRRVVRQRA